MSSEPEPYDPATLERTWQAAWARADVDAPQGDGPPCYVLEMWPYPSGELHMGHVRNYTLGDVYARFARLQGRRVLHPMGWDGFGLPAENQAIAEGIAPQVRTPANVERMRRQMRRLALSYDWSRELSTFRADYYRWNQWFFLQFWRAGWVRRRTSLVHWCPGCQTVLANEQVEANGQCWRGHGGVTTRRIAEWALAITAFADELLAGLDELQGWPERIVAQQRHWLGRSEGAHVRFALGSEEEAIEVFTTRADTLMGCTFLVLAPEHPMALRLAAPAQRAAVLAFQEELAAVDARARAQDPDRRGVFTGASARHPLSGEPVPVWLGNYVLADYASGAVMGVPAHDPRDHAFAARYRLPVRQVLRPVAGGGDGPRAPGGAEPDPAPPLTGDGELINSGPFDGLSSAAARGAVAAALAERGAGGPTVQWNLRDWGISRQRYWGTPIPVVHCPRCAAVPVPEADLPVVLPDFADVALDGQGGAPLAKNAAFVATSCPRCGGPARREVDTMDTFVDSAWYFARFPDPGHQEGPVNRAAADPFLPVDIYVGGPEHAVMHLLYFRFWTRAMHRLGLVGTPEPVRRLVTQGMVQAMSFCCPAHGYQVAADQLARPPEQRRCPTCGGPLVAAMEKMSKSKRNGLDPSGIVERHGADCARLYTLFAAPPDKDLEWSDEGVEGVARFLGRLWRLVAAWGQALATPPAGPPAAALGAAERQVRRAAHQALARIGEQMRGRGHFNVAVAALMEMVNALYLARLHEPGVIDKGVAGEVLRLTAQMLSPLAPHLAEEIWRRAGGAGLVCQSRWPEPDPEACRADEVVIAVQVNGRRRGEVRVSPEASRDELAAAAAADPQVARHLAGRRRLRTVVVPGRLVNLVVADGPDEQGGGGQGAGG